MANLNAVIVPAKELKGGKHKIRIAVSHNSKTRYIVTDITIDSAKEFKDGRIVKRPDAAFKNTKLRGLLDKYQEAVDNLGFVESLSCEELVAQIKDHDRYRHRTVMSIYQEYISVKSLKASTLKDYDRTMRSICGFVGENTLMENISYSMVMGLEKYLRGKNNDNNTIRKKQLFLMCLYFYAQKSMYIPYKADPWFGYIFPEETARESWLTVAQVAQLRDYDFKCYEMNLVRDMFMLSYYLGGINMIDLLQINFDEANGHICFERSKTDRRAKVNKYVEFDIPDVALPLIKKYLQPDGTLFPKSKNRDLCFGPLFSYYFPKIKTELGFKELTYYTARKSFSQHALELGILECVIDFILGHKLNKKKTSLWHYVQVTSEKATEAVAQVCESLNNYVPLRSI